MRTEYGAPSQWNGESCFARLLNVPVESAIATNVQRETTLPEGQCLGGRPRPPFVEGVENKLRRSPRRGLLCDRPLPRRCRFSPPLYLVYVRALPAGEPTRRVERFTPVM
jgi:hypothetical protein